MTAHDKDLQEEKELVEEMQAEVDAIENEEGQIDEELLEDAQHPCTSDEIVKLKDALARSQADFENFKKRTERDRVDMMFFLKADIFKKILPRVDDLERMLENTPEDQQNAVYKGLQVAHKKFADDLKNMGLEVFDSVGQEVNPDFHDVMTQAPGAENTIITEFEKGYKLGDRVVRHAKVVAGNGM